MEVGEKIPRDFYISQRDAEKHGYTKGCGGCSSWFRGLGRQPHTEACRNRFRELMKNDAKVKNNEVRRNEFEKRMEYKRRKIVEVGEETVKEKNVTEEEDGQVGEALVKGEKRKMNEEEGDQELQTIREALEEYEDEDRRAKKK